MHTMPGNIHTEPSQAVAPIDKLDVPCLIRVLQQVSSQQQLVICGAVCSKWRKATREAISSISVRVCTQQKCDELQQWATDPPAALYKLSLHVSVCRQQPGLRLRVSVLQHLRDLELHSVRLEGLAADGSVLKIAVLLPRLQRCTKVAFAACGTDPLSTAAIAAFKGMPALEDLAINCHELPGLDLAALPTTLTRLCLKDAPRIDNISAAGICQLRELRVLEATAYGCDTSVLACCSALERVVLDIGADSGFMFSGEEGFTTPLLVFANMPNLQHLHLRSGFRDLVATAAEVAALSASSNLTYLSLGDGEYYALPPAAYDSWFPAGRQCPHLQHMDMGVWVLGNTAAVQRMASACPGLKELELEDPDPTNMRLESACVAASLQALTNLTSLTRLRVYGYHLPDGSCISPDVVNAWSHWTGLRQLELTIRCNQVEDLVVLSQLRSLRKLALTAYNRWKDFTCELLSTQAGGPPDVWCQVPAVVWGAAVTRKEQQVSDLQEKQQREQARVTALLERQKTAQTEAATLSEQQAAAEAHATALRQQHAVKQAMVVALQHEQAAAQARAAALQDQKAADQAGLAALLQKQQQAEAAVLRVQLQEQLEEIAVLRQQADAGQTQLTHLQGRMDMLQGTVTALLERQG